MNEIYVTYFTREPKPVRATAEAGLLRPTCSRSRPLPTWTN